MDLEVAAVEAPYTIIDWRHENRNKETEVNSILQKDKKTVVYVEDSVALKEKYPEACILSYGAPLPEGTATVVFWDGGAEKVLQPGKFPLKGDQPGRLYLLYGREDLLARRDTLRRQYPDVAGLRCATEPSGTGCGSRAPARKPSCSN